jgi:hypothetical protein
LSSALPLEGESTRQQPPLVLRWGESSEPLPVRSVQFTGTDRPGFPQLEPPPWFSTGPTDQPFDFGAHVRRLCADIAARCDGLRHVDVSRLLIGMTQARSERIHGLQARVTPLRFRGGKLTRKRGGIHYQVQRYFVDAREMLYLMTFCLPRFLDQEFDSKLITIFHELYHIGPAFDGDLRRHEGRYSVHSHSQRDYDDQMAHLARAYLGSQPDPSLHAFLRLDFSQLMRRHGSVIGVVVPRPKLIPLANSEA